MTEAEARQVLDDARTWLAKWEKSGVPGHSTGDKIKRVFDRADDLFAIAEGHPTLAGEAAALARSYGVLGKQFR